MAVKAQGQTVVLDEIGVFEGCQWPMDLYLKDDRLFIADYYEGLIIVDVSDPTSPVELGRFFDGGKGHSARVNPALGGAYYLIDLQSFY